MGKRCSSKDVTYEESKQIREWSLLSLDQIASGFKKYKKIAGEVEDILRGRAKEVQFKLGIIN